MTQIRIARTIGRAILATTIWFCSKGRVNVCIKEGRNKRGPIPANFNNCENRAVAIVIKQ